MTPADVSASLTRALDLLGGTTSDHDRRVIDLDRHPGEPLAHDGDPEGRRADEAAARWENGLLDQARWSG